MNFLNKIVNALFKVESFSDVPVHVTLFRLYVKQVWQYLGCAGDNGQPLKIAIFCAGRHTAWLLQITEHLERQPLVVAVLDDAGSATDFHGYPLVRPADFNPASADLILLSSDTVSAMLEDKCKQLYGSRIKILNMYAELPQGPYYKEFEQFDKSSYVS